MPTKTQGREAPGEPEDFVSDFDEQGLDIFTGEGTRGEEVDVDEEALAKKADEDEKNAKKAAKNRKKKRFGFG
jgi:F0F1-type ATP synthase epsilon subunit